MPQPLSDAVVATLKKDACAALAAIMVISNAHSELLAWAQRSLGRAIPRKIPQKPQKTPMKMWRETPLRKIPYRSPMAADPASPDARPLSWTSPPIRLAGEASATQTMSG